MKKYRVAFGDSSLRGIWDRELALLYESELIRGFKPKFNNIGMVGK